MKNHTETLACPSCGRSPVPFYKKNIVDKSLEVRVNCQNKCAGIEIGMTFPDFFTDDEVHIRVLGNWNLFVERRQEADDYDDYRDRLAKGMVFDDE